MILFERQEFEPSHHQDKVIGESLPVDENSKRTAGQLREEAGPCTDHVFPCLGQETSPTRHVPKGSVEVKGA